MSADKMSRRKQQWLILIGLTLLSVLLHFVVTDQVGRNLVDDEDGDGGSGKIKRMEAAYVKELKLSAPPVGMARPVAALGPGKSGKAKKNKIKPVEKASEPEDKASQPKKTIEESASAPSAPQVAESTASEATQVAEAPKAAEPPASAPVNGPTFEWPKATKVSYLAKGNFRGPVTGSGSVEWLRTGSKYQVHLDFRVGGIMSSVSSSEGIITPDGVYPKRNEAKTTIFFSDKITAIDLGDDEITLANGNKVARPVGVQDMISNIVQLAYEFTLNPSLSTIGTTIEKQIATKDRLLKATFTIDKQEVINSPMGPLKVFHIKPSYVNEDNRPLIDLDVWLSPELQYLPVKIVMSRTTGPKANQFQATLEMERPPQQVGAQD